MSSSKDYYEILGVIEDADLKVIKAAYKALVSIYHPDRNKSEEDSHKIYEINEAYDILVDAKKREQYDQARKATQHDATPAHFSTQKPFSEDPIEQDWFVAEGFFPLLKTQFKQLSLISWNLAFAFRLELLDSQDFQDSKRIYNQMKFEYLNKYFGKNPDILWFAEQLIINKHVKAALDLNNYVKVMGKSITIGSVREKIKEFYPDINIPYHVSIQEKQFKNLYRYIKNPIKPNQALAMEAIEYYLKHQKGTLRKGFFGGYSLDIYHQTLKFKQFEQLAQFIIEEFQKSYGFTF